jgi:serine protease
MLLSLTAIDRALTYKTLGIDYLEAYDALQSNDPEQQLKRDTLRLVKALNRRPDVLYATPNYLRQGMAVNPNDPLYPLQWHYPLLNLPQAWDLNTGDGAIVAVIDSGVLVTHPDLQGQLLEGYDFIKNPADANDGDSSIEPDPNDPGDGALPSGSSFHGTHVAGTIAATTDNAAGVAGSAFFARLMPLRVAGRLGIATDYDVEQAVRFAARLPNDSGTLPPRRADVINLSLGGPAFSAASEAIFNQARAAGVAIVAAAGNEAGSTALYPASYAGVISVSAVDINKALAPYSNFGPFIDVAAPGGNNAQDINGDGKPDGVLSTAASDSEGIISPNYVYYSGTSMAAAHVSGVIALMRSTNPRLTPQDIDNLLISGAITEDLGTPGRDDRYGHGLLNAYRAVVAASNTPGGQPVTPIPILVVNPTALNFGLALSSLTLTVRNGGGGDLKVNPPSENSGGWLRLSAAVDGNGLGSYTLTVDRANLPDGLYTTTLTFTSNANTVQVPVIMQIAQNLATGDVGPQYVLLVEPTTLQTKSQAVAVRLDDGRYSYRFENIPAGTYQIFAGSDLNNDGFICDSGESCGAYLTLDKPIQVQVNGNRSDLDFASGFTANLTAPTAPTTQAQSGLLRSGAGKHLRSHR